MIDALFEIIESIWRQRLRALATAFGVFWGILMLVVLLGCGRGLRNGLDKLFADTLINSVWINLGRTTSSYQGLAPGRSLTLTSDDVTAIGSAIPELELLSPRQGLPAAITISYRSRTASFQTFGIAPGHSVIERTTIVRGRLLSELDVARSRKVALLGQRVVDTLFGSSDPIGQEVLIGGVPFLVVGQFTDPGGEGELVRVFIPYTTLRSTFDARGYVGTATALLRPGASFEEVRMRVRRLLARRHRFDPADLGAVSLWGAEEDYRKLQLLLRGIDVAVIVVSLGTLLSGIVGISNILFVSVRERTAEFGLRRAIGATPTSVLALVLGEAVLLSTTAGGLGLLCGIGLVTMARRAGIRSDYFRDPSVDLRSVLFALLVLIVTALVAGYFPAREAARLNPNEALRR